MVEPIASQSLEPHQTHADRDRLILEHLKLVRAIAMRLHAGLPRSVDFSDLEQAGVLGLISAASNYDPSNQTSFPLYAKHRIKGAMLDSLRKADWVSRSLRHRQKQIDTASHELTAQLKRVPTEEEVAQLLGISVADLRGVLTELRNSTIVSSCPAGTDDDIPIDLPSSPNDAPDCIYTRKQSQQILRTAIRELPDQDQTVIMHIFYENTSCKDVARVFGLHESRVSQIRRSSLRKLGAVLRAQGIDSTQVI